MTADREDAAIRHGATGWVGRSILRFEDAAALLTGRGRYLDDLGTLPGTFVAAILRSPHAHAEIEAIDCETARTADGVAAVLTGADVIALTSSLVVGVKAPLECWPIAVDRVRYVGEPVAIVVASDRYRAEDAIDLIEVRYRPLPAVVDPAAAATVDSPLLHPAINSNVVGERTFRYGDPERAFAEAAHRVRVDVRYPRNSGTPIETYGIIAEYDSGEDAYDVLANFQGPFSLHPVVARALKVPGNRLRLRTPPDSGGSFGVKQAIFPYIVLMAVAARVAGRPVKWIEDRLEHLCASVSATNRVTMLEAAVDRDGRIMALNFDQHHWAPGTLPADLGQTIRETVFWTPPQLTAPTDADEVNSSLCHGFIFDFCGVEIDPTSGAVRLDRYVTMHDCGSILHPAMVTGQICGGFAQALGAALYEEYAYADDGSFLCGTFADYLVPTAMEVPEPIVLHRESPSPFTPLGAKGVGEGNCMSTPVCIANAIADALSLDAIDLPATPAKLAAHLHGPEPARATTSRRYA